MQDGRGSASQDMDSGKVEGSRQGGLSGAAKSPGTALVTEDRDKWRRLTVWN